MTLRNEDLEMIAMCNYQDYDDLDSQMFSLLFDVAHRYMELTGTIKYGPMVGLQGLMECLEAM